MATEERSILIEHAFLCGDHAMEWSQREFRTPAFDSWLESLAESGSPVMSMRLVRVGEVTEQAVGCACCWSVGVNEYATFAVEITIDGDG